MRLFSIKSDSTDWFLAISSSRFSSAAQKQTNKQTSEKQPSVYIRAKQTTTDLLRVLPIVSASIRFPPSQFCIVPWFRGESTDKIQPCHRDHASVSGIARCLPSAAGRLLEKEVSAFARVLNEPARPFVAVLGGAKISDKLQVVDHLLDRVTSLLVGGGMAYTFMRACGRTIGDSLVQEDLIEASKSALEKAERLGVELLLPVDHVVAERFAADARAEVVEEPLRAQLTVAK